ncbi:MAG: flagellar biosynthesis protein FlhA [Deltaproteobacteria bacterium]|nr:flagellar biosynthesis protein FlhA [Deltaproteobacteria bacterium]
MESARTPPLRIRDIAVPLGIIGVVLMMVMPLPPILLDVLLTFSVALSIVIFLTALFIQEALDFSAFPTIVLVATLLRLSLNVASTRLILLHGHEGSEVAGQMIEAFGHFVVGGQIVVGLVVFLILVVINFVVITKGSGRIAEVAARFTLDAMPGKQMAVDADLSAGNITNDEARRRRKALEQEADFYGAMDGASKFVQGDAVAGLLITGINLIGGLIIGVVRGMDIGKAAETFSVLSVGDALVSQVPALLISSAAGVVVTRSAAGEQIADTFIGQLFGRQRAVAMTAGIMALLGLVPGMPTLPLLGFAGMLAYVARNAGSIAKAADGTPLTVGSGSSAAASTPGEPGASKDPKPGSAEDVDKALALDVLTLELGYELVHLVDVSAGGTLVDRVGALRREIARELGIVVPSAHICDNLELQPGEYRILMSGNPIAQGRCANGRVLAIDPTGSAPPVEGDATIEPTFGMPARWIHPRDRDMAEALGYTVVDHATVIATHFGELIRNHAHRLLGRQEVQHLLELLAKKYPKLVDDVVPSLLSLGDVLRVLRNLLRERISIRDMRTIMEALADLSEQTKDSEQLTELVRERLATQITAAVKGRDGAVAALALDPRLEETLRTSLREIAQGIGGALDPRMLADLAKQAEAALAKFGALSAAPIVVAPPDLRRYVRAIFEHKVPQYAVVSFREVEPSVALRVVDSLGRGANPALAQGA